MTHHLSRSGHHVAYCTHIGLDVPAKSRFTIIEDLRPEEIIPDRHIHIESNPRSR
jgi:hypothetical protein